jgi:hypothetical protein
MPTNALQCSSCRNWRRDIHELIAAYHKLELTQLAALLIGGLLALVVMLNASENAGLFKSPEFPTGPVVLIVILTAVAFIVAKVPAVRTRSRIEKVTNGLWERPWWDYY